MNKYLYVLLACLVGLAACKGNNNNMPEDIVPPAPDIEVPENEVNTISYIRFYSDDVKEKYINDPEVNIPVVKLTGEAEYSLTNHANIDDGYVYICLFGERTYNDLGWSDYYGVFRIQKKTVVKGQTVRLNKLLHTPVEFILATDDFFQVDLCAVVSNSELESGSLTSLKDGTLLFSVPDKDDLFFRINKMEENTGKSSHFPGNGLFNELKYLMELLSMKK